MKLRTVAGRPIVEQRMMLVPKVSKLDRARERHGKPFAFESGSTWTPRAVPLLTEWMQSRGKQ